ncbi:hypothetical protein D3C71_2062030 [compost metagenome]
MNLNVLILENKLNSLKTNRQAYPWLIWSSYFSDQAVITSAAADRINSSNTLGFILESSQGVIIEPAYQSVVNTVIYTHLGQVSLHSFKMA